MNVHNQKYTYNVAVYSTRLWCVCVCAYVQSNTCKCGCLKHTHASARTRTCACTLTYESERGREGEREIGRGERGIKRERERERGIELLKQQSESLTSGVLFALSVLCQRQVVDEHITVSLLCNIIIIIISSSSSSGSSSSSNNNNYSINTDITNHHVHHRCGASAYELYHHSTFLSMYCMLNYSVYAFRIWMHFWNDIQILKFEVSYKSTYSFSEILCEMRAHQGFGREAGRARAPEGRLTLLHLGRHSQE